MRKIDIIESAEINTDAETAWEIIGPNFLNISQWGRGVLKSWNNDALTPIFENAPAGGRFCELAGFGTFDERIIHFDAEKFEISWSAQGEKLPKFVSGLKNQLKVERIDDSNCRITSNISADLKGIMGLILGGYLRKNFTKQVTGFLKDWKAYAETGEISAGKQREITKQAK